MSFKPISISLSPNTQKDDIWLAFKLIFQPWKFKKGKAVEQLENEFKKYFDVKHATSFNSGRSSMLAIMKSLELKAGSEVLLQAFTCNAAANPVIWAELEPKYVDCDENDFNIDINDLRNKMSSKSRAIMVQHTFGMPANMADIADFADKNNLVLIEDCAHSLGAEYDGKKVGTFG
ncbi:MAG: aminotransferase class I/II-fold pyridoxal phosphate-dependent enzyme, partial [Candidatus Nealsonbacteria bacterium]|nr:aminotransferase class I/II-fold pyridoxal phosphate-dependent enzyme [Candidatus Nealsonbacteria bacterium]